MKQIGTWSRSKGSIVVNIPKSRKVGSKLYPTKIKYLGDPEDPFSPAAVENDLESELKKIIILQPTSSRGGKIITP